MYLLSYLFLLIFLLTRLALIFEILKKKRAIIFFSFKSILPVLSSLFLNLALLINQLKVLIKKD